MNKFRLFTKDTALVIVDMQPKFSGAKCDKTTKRILSLIQRAKQHKSTIVVLEYDSWGPTRSDIIHAIGKYDKCHVMTKWTDDGSNEVLQCVKSAKHFVLCGVNFGACVLDTARGLINSDQKVIVVKNACNNGDGFIRDFSVYEARFPTSTKMRTIR